MLPVHDLPVALRTSSVLQSVSREVRINPGELGCLDLSKGAPTPRVAHASERTGTIIVGDVVIFAPFSFGCRTQWTQRDNQFFSGQPRLEMRLNRTNTGLLGR